MNVPSPICNEPSLGELCPSLTTAVKSENKMSWEEMNLSVSKKRSVIFYVYLFCFPFRGEWGETQWVFLTYRRCEIQTGVTVGTTKALKGCWGKQRMLREGPAAQQTLQKGTWAQFTFIRHGVCHDGLVRDRELHSLLSSWMQACWGLGSGKGLLLFGCALWFIVVVVVIHLGSPWLKAS